MKKSGMRGQSTGKKVRLVVIEWAKASKEMGLPLEHRLSVEELDD